MVDTIGNFIGDKYRGVAKGFMTVLKESKFYEQGVLTPEEFTAAGDYLTSKCPTWKWCSNKPNCVPADYLNKEKQFLQTTVPCRDRVKSIMPKNENSKKEKIVEGDWVETIDEFNTQKKTNKEITDIDIDKTNNNNKNKIVDLDIKDDYMGIETIKDSDIDNNCNKEEDDFVIIEQNDDNIIKSRMYDVMITYDFYYRTPRMWLVGYSESGNPLTDDEVKEDIMMEYIDKTVTIEKLPNTGIKSVSIHPCKHANLLLKMIENFERGGKKLEVEKSIVLLLKFLRSVVPTINYDFTMDIDF